MFAAALFFTLVGCEFEEGVDAHIPGDDLGTFHVAATMDVTTCGPGALGSPDSWEFDIRLSQSGTELFWLNGDEAIPGRVDTDSFQFDSAVEVPLAEPEPGAPGCVIVRGDLASGRFGFEEDEVTSFDGSLVYSYAPTAESDCDVFVGVEGGFGTLPCSIAYRIDATRTVAPKSRAVE